MAKVISRGPANIDTMLAMTDSLYGKELREQVWLNNKVSNAFLKGQGIKEVTGGVDIVEDINYAFSGTVKQITADSTLDTTVGEFATQARYHWAALGGTLAVKDWDVVQNAGAAKRHDILASQLSNLMEEFSQSLESILVGAVTVSSASIWSLLDVVDSADPSVANYGGIDRDDYSWWGATETGSLASANIREAMETAINTTGKNGTDKVSHLFTTQTLYEAWQSRLVAHERLAQSDKGQLGYKTLMCQDVPMDYSHAMLANTLLGINFKHTKMYVNTKMNFSKSPMLKAPGSQAEAAMVRLMLQTVCTRPKSNFKLTFTS